VTAVARATAVVMVVAVVENVEGLLVAVVAIAVGVAADMAGAEMEETVAE
jgi:hypothetical protein